MLRVLMSPLVLLLAFMALSAPGLAQEQTPELTAEEARALAQILQDDASRQALVDKLNAMAEAQPSEADGTLDAAKTELKTLPRRIAEFTQDSAQSASEFLATLLHDLRGLAVLGDGSSIDYEAIGQTALELGLVIAITVLVFAGLNLVTRRVYARLSRVAARAGLAGALALLLGSIVIDALVVAVAWGIGYAAAISALGTAGEMDIVESLYLNAFLLIEMIKVVLRGVFSPRYTELRLHPMSDLDAAYWYHWLARIVSFLGYGSLFVVPVVTADVTYAAGRSLQVLIALTGLAMAILVIMQNRRRMQDRLRARADQRGDFLAKVGAALGRVWHVVAIAYVVALFAIWISRPGDALAYMLAATGRTAAAVLIGYLVVLAISRAITGGLKVPQDMRERLPLLEDRLNALVPNILRIVRVVVLVLVVGAVLDAWDVVDLGGWLTGGTGQVFLGAILSAAAILLVAWLIWLALSSWVEYRLNPDVGSAPSARERTLLQLLRNAATVVLAALAVMLALSQIGVEIGPLLAGAGVVGLAVGFGAQKLVQDVITGVFIQFENAFNEGDVVSVGGTTGVVERLTIRSVGIRDLSGVYHIVPFSAVDTVSNFMREFAYHIAAIGVAYREDIGEVKEAMHDAFEELRGTEHGESLIGDLEMQGVTEFADSAVTVRARIKTRPGQQWAVGRAYNEIVKRVFDDRGIEIPFPHRTIYWGEDKQGKAPPLRVARVGEDEKEQGKGKEEPEPRAEAVHKKETTAGRKTARSGE